MKSGWEGCRDGDPRTRDKPFIAVLLLLPPCLPPSLLTLPRGPGQDNHSPLLSQTFRKGHYRPHLTDGDTKTWGKATPGLCPGVGPRADTCWSPVPFTPASLQPWRARWSLAASRAKHDRLCAETGKGEAREARGTAAGSSRRSSAPGRILSILHLSSRFIHIPRT